MLPSCEACWGKMTEADRFRTAREFVDRTQQDATSAALERAAKLFVEKLENTPPADGGDDYSWFSRGGN